jgi:hypothetical protein
MNHNKQKDNKGITAWIIFGRFAGFQFMIFQKPVIFRFVIGWICFNIVSYDVEETISFINNESKRLKNNEKILNNKIENILAEREAYKLKWEKLKKRKNYMPCKQTTKKRKKK